MRAGLMIGSMSFIVRRYITANGRTMPMAKDAGAKAKLNHTKISGENVGKMNRIHKFAKLWTIPEVRETSKDAMKNFALNNMGLPRRHFVAFLLYALLVIVVFMLS